MQESLETAVPKNDVPARQAAALYRMIQARTVELVTHSTQLFNPLYSPTLAEQRNLANLEAFTLGRNLPQMATIQQLERYSTQWATLIPLQPDLQAHLAHHLAERYIFRQQDIPSIRAALGFDGTEVQAHYEELFGKPLHSIYARDLPLSDWLYWGWSKTAHRLEQLSPFWTAFAYTFTELMGIGIVVLPIAVAGVGAWGAVLLLLVLGLVMSITRLGLIEALTRSSFIRAGKGWWGAVAHPYWGMGGARLLWVILLADSLGLLLLFYLGAALTLETVTPISGTFWLPASAGLICYVLVRSGWRVTAAMSMVIGFVNLLLLLLVALVSLSTITSDFLNQSLFLEHHFEVSAIRWAVGVALMTLLGLRGLVNYAPQVLQQDPTGRDLTWGTLGAQWLALGLLCGWVMITLGGVEPAVLVAQPLTIFQVLAENGGRGIAWLGLLVVLLICGVGILNTTLAVVNALLEWLPCQTQRIIFLPQGDGRLIFRLHSLTHADSLISLTYLGVDGAYRRFRLEAQLEGSVRRWEIIFLDQWDSDEWVDQLPAKHRSDVEFSLRVVAATPQGTLLAFNTSMHLAYVGDWQTLPFLELLEKMHQVEVADFSQGRSRRLSMRLWRALDPDILAEVPAIPSMTFYARRRLSFTLSWILAHPYWRFVLALSPVVILLAVAEWLVYSQMVVFTDFVAVVGLISSTLMGSMVVLLLLASRQGGEFIPPKVYQWVGDRRLMGGLGIFFIGLLVLHGLVLWDGWVRQGLALGAAGLGLWSIFQVWLTGAFKPQLVLEVCAQAGEGIICRLWLGGKPYVGEWQVAEVPEMILAAQVEIAVRQQVRLYLSEAPVGAIKVWAYRRSPAGYSQTLGGMMTVQGVQLSARYDLSLNSGQFLIPLSDGVTEVTFSPAVAEK